MVPGLVYALLEVVTRRVETWLDQNLNKTEGPDAPGRGV